MAINPSVKSYVELDVTEDYQVRMEHVHDKKYDLHQIKIMRKNTQKDVMDGKRPHYSDIDFNLSTDMFIQFCKFFENIGGVRYGNK
jgi:hypothetical protein